ncbi:rRNA-processing protein EFG1 [Saitozyma sp. JCM 24511]|nr:rRNA-processing protein EFG1 [Saitozyma sp. JCM 24511]
MPPAPKSPRQPRAGPSTLPGTHRAKSLAQRDPEGLPGVSKIKASIRQTKRFLAKDNLEPGLRVQTQRRLTSLMADLERAERRGVEKKFGARYHKVCYMSTSQSQSPNPQSSILNPQSAGSSRDPDPNVGPPREVVIAGKHSDQTSEVLVKFFAGPATRTSSTSLTPSERQKLLRLIKRFQKAASASSATDKETKRAERAEQDLERARVMLNYILHFPNTEKYIALFPDSESASDPDSSATGAAAAVDAKSSTLSLPPHLTPPLPDRSALDKSSARRLEVLLSMRKAMGDGKVPGRPEEGLGDGKESIGAGERRGRGKVDLDLDLDLGMGGGGDGGKEEVKGKGKAADQTATNAERSGKERRLEVDDGRGKKSKRTDEAGRAEGEDASGEKRTKKRKSEVAEEENNKGEEGKEKSKGKSKEEKRAKSKTKGKETPVTAAAAKPAVADEQDDFFESD